MAPRKRQLPVLAEPRIAALEAERDVLAEALREIAEPKDGLDHHNHCYDQRRTARAALKEAT